MTPRLTDLRDQTFTLPELCLRAEALIRSVGSTPADQRVTPFPDVRTTRYYQTLGLVDRPLRHDGRSAIYGYRHLLQAVAVKLLQNEGWSLSRLQQSLAGVSTEALEVAVEESLLPSGEAAPPAEARPDDAQRAHARAAPAPPGLPAPPGPAPWVAAALAPGLVISIDPALHPDPPAIIAALSLLFSASRPDQELP